MNQSKIKAGAIVLSLALLIVLAACSPAAAVETPASAQPASAASPAADTSQPAAAESAVPAAFTKLNLNTASGDEFLTIPGMGSRMVREFNEYRPYASIKQFRREIGKYVSEEQVAAYEQYVFVPIDVNNADLETLMQITGLDEANAQLLIDSRPFGSTGDFLAQISQYITAEQLQAASAMLAAP